jgi:D-sedoheptulose 7-phosphate isomerase
MSVNPAADASIARPPTPRYPTGTMRSMDDDHSVADTMVRIAERIADGLGNGGRLLVDGQGRGLADARHVVVEFMHPVTVGKRALPAFQGFSGRRVVDVTMSIAYGGPEPDVGADIVFTDVDADPIDSQLVLALPSTVGDAKVAAVLGYHVVWELVHLFLESSSVDTDDAPAASALYPMLYTSDEGPDDRTGLRAAARRSAQAKIAESADTRAATLGAHAELIARAADLVGRAGSVFTIGNGGSSTDATDAAMALGPKARSLADDVATISALANDVAFDVVFARQLVTVAEPGDCVVAFSTSGNSTNVIEAARAAKRIGVSTVGLTGYDGGEMASSDAFDVVLVVASDSVHRIQEAHSAMIEAMSIDARSTTG